MSLLTDTDILAILSSTSSTNPGNVYTQSSNWDDFQDKLLIHPFRDELLSPIGYDLTIGSEYLSYRDNKIISIDQVNGSLRLGPGETVLVTTGEYVGLPKNKSIGGIIQSKVSIVSLGIGHISTTVDPDWEGYALVAITNHQPYSIELEKGTSFCTLMLFSTLHAATRSGNKLPGRKEVMIRILADWQAKASNRQNRFKTLLLISPLVIFVLLFAIGLLNASPTDTPTYYLLLATGMATVLAMIYQNTKT